MLGNITIYYRCFSGDPELQKKLSVLKESITVFNGWLDKFIINCANSDNQQTKENDQSVLDKRKHVNGN